MDRFKFEMIYSIGGVQKTSIMHPKFSEIELSKDLSEYRDDVKCKTKFTFYNDKSNGISDFDVIKNIETEDIFQTVTIKVSELSGGSYNYFKTLFFSVVDASIDDDRCTAECPMLFEDIYACLLANWEKEYNALNLTSPVPVYRINNPANLELFKSTSEFNVFLGCLGGLPLSWLYTVSGNAKGLLTVSPNGNNAGNAPQSEFGLDAGLLFDYNQILGSADDIYPTHPGNGDIFHPIHQLAVFSISNFYTQNYPYWNSWQPINTQLSKWRIYKNKFTVLSQVSNHIFRCRVETTWCCETTFTADITNPGDAPMPSGSDWIPFNNPYIAGIKGVMWGREPFWTKFDEHRTADSPGGGEHAYSYFHSGNCSEFEFTLKNPYTWSPASMQDIRRGRYLVNTIQEFLNKAGCDLVLNSELLGYDGTISNASNINDTNPVYPSERNPVYIINCAKDIKYPLPTDMPETTWMFSLKKLIENICSMFNARWYIKDNKFIIEHLSYFENNYSYNPNNNAPTIDLTGIIDNNTGKPEIISTNKYKYNVEQIYDKETWEFEQYLDYDFAKLSVNYNIRLNAGSNTKQEMISIITDVAGVLSEPSKFSDDSIVMVACLYDGGVLVSVNEQGYRSNMDVTNGYLCLSNLFDRYYRHGRVLLKGQLDAKTDSSGVILYETFLSAIYKKLQEITMRDCDASIFFNNNLVKTNLGTGRILTADHKAVVKTTKLNILI